MKNSVNFKPPIIVCGMHRSGTSLLSKILSEINVFMGKYQDNNNESIYFQRLNRWLMSCVGSSWDNPKSFSKIDTEILENKLLCILNQRLNSLPYFGLYKTFKNESFSNIACNWGWKDPSNTFTLPVWNKLFPESKIIYVLRHPLDVSISLLNRNNHLKNVEKQYKNIGLFANFSSILAVSKGGVSSSFLVDDIDDCLRLYNSYYNEIISYNKSENLLFIKYEDLLLNTESILNDLAHFTSIHISDEEFLKINLFIDKSRAYAYKDKSIKYSKHHLNNNIYNEK